MPTLEQITWKRQGARAMVSEDGRWTVQRIGTGDYVLLDHGQFVVVGIGVFPDSPMHWTRMRDAQGQAAYLATKERMEITDAES